MATKAYELLTQIKDICLISGTGQDSVILQKMNLGQWQLYNSYYHWRTLEANTTASTVASQASVSVPSTVAMIYTVRQTSTSPYIKLNYHPPHKFHRLVPQPTNYAEGKPTDYTWWGGSLWLYPIPDAVYTLTIYNYKKPVNMKIYTTGTATHSGTTVTGTTTAWLDNSNVDTNMSFAYQADSRSDGTYTWSTISAVANTSLTISTYGGASSSGNYVCSSSSTFNEDFDLALIYATSLMMGAKFREIKEIVPWLTDQYRFQYKGLVEAQTSVPDHAPILEDFTPVPINYSPLGEAYKYPFIRESM